MDDSMMDDSSELQPDSVMASEVLAEFRAGDSTPDKSHIIQIDNGVESNNYDTVPRRNVTNIQRFKAPYQTPKGSKLVREVPAGIFKAVNTRAELYAQHRQRYYTRKHEAKQKKNMVISVYKEDVLVRVLVSESLPFLCALCGESFAHTTHLREHAEQVHSYFQAVAKKKPNKSQIIIERSFDPKSSADSANAEADNTTKAPVKESMASVVQAPEENGELDYSMMSDTDLHNNSSDEELITRLVEDAEKADESHIDRKQDQNDIKQVTNNVDIKEEISEQILDPPKSAEGGIVVKKKEKKGKRRKRKRKEYELVSSEGGVKVNAPNVDETVEEEAAKKRKIRNPSPCCVVCGLRNKTRVIYRQHLADAHHIFSCAEEAFEYGKKLNMQGNPMDSLPDEETGIPGESLGTGDSSSSYAGRKATSLVKKKMMKCEHCETFVFDKVLMAKHMRAHCGLPGLKCDICTEGVRLWEEGKMSEVRGLMEKFQSVDRREEDVDYVYEDEEGENDEESDVIGKSKRNVRFNYSNIVSSCYECGEKYYMRYHMGLHHKKAHSHFTCKECNTTVPSLQTLKTHSMKYHSRGIFQCPYCPRAFHDRGKYNYHHAGHMGIYKCPGCGRSFLEKPSLNHLTKYANHPTHFEETGTMKEEYSLEKPYIFDGYVEKPDVFPIEIACPVCQETFSNAGNLTKHMNAMHPELLNHETNFVCDSCGKMFGNRKNLRAHQKTHVKKFRCTFEGSNKAYHMLYKLKEHLHAHSATKNFHCEHCDKSFKTMASLRFHRRVHNEDAPVYQCHICAKTYRTRTDLRYHLEGVHGTEKNYQCETCGKRFTTKLRLASHASIHKEKKFPCDKCPASFRARQLLEVHERTHNKPFACKECMKSFNKEDSYQRHLYTKHNIGEPVPKRAYNSSKRKALTTTQVVTEEPVQDFSAEEVVSVRVEFPPGQPMTSETLVALIQGLNPLP